MELSYHSGRVDASLCNGCLACVRTCPTQALRVRGGVARMLDDCCIDCGECLKACGREAVRPLTGSLADLSKFDYTVAVPSLALFTQFDLTEAPPAVVLEALRRCGFDDAVGLSAGCLTVSNVIEEYLGDHRGQHPVISSFCPTVVRLVQVKYPALLDQLLPVLSPREVVAREVKRRKVAETGLPRDRMRTPGCRASSRSSGSRCSARIRCADCRCSSSSRSGTPMPGARSRSRPRRWR